MSNVQNAEPAQDQIQAVLALLPELFPGTQEIPLANIRPNPDNPGPPASEEEIDELAANIAEVGLKNPAKVRPEPTGPLAPGVTLHPDNPRLKGDGTPWKVEDFIYRLISGHSRWRAFQKLQRATLPSQVLNPTEEEAVILGRADNQVRSDRGWWADYQEVENLIKAAPVQTQGGIAAKLKMDRKRVGRAISLLPLLNPEARALIRCSAPNSNKGNKGLSDKAAYQLAVLGPGTGLKPGVRKGGDEAQRLWPYPAIPAETQELVYRTLKEACDRGLTEAGVKGLVEWVKTGNEPGDYDPAKAVEPPRAPSSPSTSKPGEPNPIPQGLTAPELGPAATNVLGAILGAGRGKHRGQVHKALTNSMKGWGLNLAIRSGKGMVQFFEKIGFKDPLVPTVVVLLVFLMFVSSVPRYIEHMVHQIATAAHANASMALAQPNPVAQPEASQQMNAPMGAVPRNDGSAVTTIPPSSPFVKGGDKAKHKKAAGTTVAPVGNQPSNPSLEAWAQGAGSPKEPAQPNRAPQLEAWAQADKPLALEVARHFYEVTGLNFDDEKKYFKTAVTGDYYPVFVEKYFPLSRQTELSQNRQVTYFKPTGEVKLLGVTENTDSFRVEGIQTTVSRLNPRQNKYLGDKPVALVVRLRHTAGFKPLADQVGEVEPETVVAPKGNEDPLKVVGEKVKDVSHAVNTVDDALGTAGRTGRIFGF